MPKLSYKIVLLGNPAVGKTNIILRYVKNTFVENLGATIGVNFLIKPINIEYDGKNHEIELVIWDIGGFSVSDSHTLNKLYCKGAHAGIYVYDLARYSTFENLKKWEENTPPTIIRCLVGNKKDLKELQEVSHEEGRKKALMSKATIFFETSAKTGEGVEEMFFELASVLVRNSMIKKQQQQRSNI